MRTYLVTGGAGFIGSNYIHYMFRKYDNEIRIINVDVLTYAGNLENLKDIADKPNYTFVRADICDKEAIEKIFAENDIDRVVHFAAESHVDRSIKNPEVFVKTNVLGTAVMLNAAKKAWELPDGTFKPGKKFLHVSTDEVYGSLSEDGGYFYETTPYAPHSPYSASKAGSDMLVKAYMDTYHFPANITNCSNNYGPYQFPEKLIPLIINNALHIMPQPEKALQEIKRVLKEDGVLIAPTFTHAGNSFSGKVKAFFMELAGFPLHSRWTSEEYLRFLRQNGWTVRKSAVLKASFPLTYAECVKMEV